MPRRRLHEFSMLAILLVLALGWTGDSYGSSATSRATAPQAAPPALSRSSSPRSSGPRHEPPDPPPPGPPSVSLAPVASAPTDSGPPFAAGTVGRTTGGDSVALTFDDGPGDQTLAILGLLRRYQIKATFCLIGVHVRDHPELVQAIVRDGHTLCNHTWSHDLRLGQRSPDIIRSDLQRTSNEIHKAAPGVPVRYFRQPGGMWTPVVVSIAQYLGMASLGWDVDPSDWNVAAYPVGPEMTNHVITNVREHVHPGAIVLSHDAGGNRTSTLAAYRTLLPYLLDERRLHLAPLPPGLGPSHDHRGQES